MRRRTRAGAPDRTAATPHRACARAGTDPMRRTRRARPHRDRRPPHRTSAQHRTRHRARARNHGANAMTAPGWTHWTIRAIVACPLTGPWRTRGTPISLPWRTWPTRRTRPPPRTRRLWARAVATMVPPSRRTHRTRPPSRRTLPAARAVPRRTTARTTRTPRSAAPGTPTLVGATIRRTLIAAVRTHAARRRGRPDRRARLVRT